MAVYLGNKKIAPIVRIEPSDIIKAELERKANVDGSYETLHAGTASDLTSDAGLPVSGVFVKATLPVATGDGLLTISEIRGHTAKVQNFVDPSTRWYADAKTCSISTTENGNLLVTRNGVATDLNVSVLYKENVTLPTDVSAKYTYFFRYKAKPSADCDVLVNINGKNTPFSRLRGGVWNEIFGLSESTKNPSLSFVVSHDNPLPNDGTIEFENKVLVLNATHAYGKGNVPKDPSQVNKDFPYYIPFSEASLLYNGTASSLVSRDSSGAIVDSLEIKTPPARSAGSAFDSFSFEGKLTRRINVYTFSGNERVSNYLGGDKTLCVHFPKDTIPFTPLERVANAMWAYGPTVNTNSVANSCENAISMFTASIDVDFLAVRTGKTADELKAWLKGKHLYYETKNPTETQAEPFRKAVKVKAGGSLSFEGGNGYPLGLGAVAQKSIKNFAEGLGNEVGWEPSNLALKSDLTAPKEIPLELRDDEGQLTFSVAECFEEGHWISIDIQGTMTPTSTVIANKALAVSGFLSEETLARLAYLNDRGTVLKGSIAFGDEALSNAPISFALLNVVKASNNRLYVYHGDFSGLEVGKTYFFNVHGRILLADVAKEAHR